MHYLWTDQGHSIKDVDSINEISSYCWHNGIVYAICDEKLVSNLKCLTLYSFFQISFGEDGFKSELSSPCQFIEVYASFGWIFALSAAHDLYSFNEENGWTELNILTNNNSCPHGTKSTR
jgi:hypothetical protein